MLIDQVIEKPSKTKRKLHSHNLQNLGVQLTKLTKEQLLKLDLPTTLFEAIIFAKTINTNGALRRHLQYIGKLMRGIDEQIIQNKLAMLITHKQYKN